MMEFRATLLHGIEVPADEEYIAAIEDLLASEEVRSMEKYTQHGGTTCLRHSINVSYLAYRYCKQQGWDAVSAARGGLLHDLFLYDWHDYQRKPGERLHGFEHPRKALENASRLFTLNETERDVIVRHMFPLTLTPPKTKEAYSVTMFDKYCSLMETFRRPVLALRLAENPA